jgi:hypothetical protein
MRRTAVLVLLLICGGVVAALLLLSGGSGRDSARDLAGSLGLVDDPPFEIRLSGPLWQDRTLKSEDGAPDLGYVTNEEALTAVIAGGSDVGVAQVELRVDGRRQRLVRPACSEARCPTRLRLTFKPRLATELGGPRRVQVIVRDPKARGEAADVGSHVSEAALTVNVGRRLPLAREGEPVTVTVSRSNESRARLRRLRVKALRVLSAERRRGVLGELLGRARLGVSDVGVLTANGQPVGATLLLELAPHRRHVTATVPAYVPALRGSEYRPQTVRVSATVLRDLLVDVDLGRRKVIAIEPGPRSSTKAWAPSRAAAPAGAADED